MTIGSWVKTFLYSFFKIICFGIGAIMLIIPTYFPEFNLNSILITV